MNSDFLIYKIIIIASGSCCVGLFSYIVLSVFKQAHDAHVAAQNQLMVPEATSGLVRSFLPLARGLGAGMRSVFSGGREDTFYGRFHEWLVKRISAAGTPQGLTAEEYVGFGIIHFIFGAGLGMMFYALLYPKTFMEIHWWAIIAGGLFVMRWHGWLGIKRERYQTSIRRALPFSLDLLTLSMEAGLDFTSALARIVSKIGDTPLGKEYAYMLREIQLGKTRSQALRDFARRVDVTDVRSVVASLVQAEELGASLGPILRIQAAQQRERRSQTAEEKAMKAPVKILFPLVVCLFPCVLLVLFGPFVIKFLL